MTAIFKLLQSASCSKGEHRVPLYATKKQKRCIKKLSSSFQTLLTCVSQCVQYISRTSKRGLKQPAFRTVALTTLYSREISSIDLLIT